MIMNKDINAIDVVRQMVADGQASQEVAEKYFPELKEREDDKIRKALISILKTDFEKDTTIYDISVGDIIAWLEKQGEKPTEWSEKDKCMINNIIDTLKPLRQTTHSGYSINSMITWLKSLKDRVQH